MWKLNYLVVVILNDPGRLPELLKRWRAIGVAGTTVLKSQGGFTTETLFARLGLAGILSSKDVQHQRTVFSLIDDETLLENAIAEADDIVGGFDRPGRGLLFVLPVARTLGLQKWETAGSAGLAGLASLPEGMFKRNTPISQVISLLDLRPVIVSVSWTLEAALTALLENPRVDVASVVNESGHLVGLLDSAKLADGLLVSIFPEEFMSDLEEIERMIRVTTQSRFHRVSDLMQAPASLHKANTLKEAFQQIHRSRLRGLPVVDENHQVIGHLNLIELLAAFLEPSEKPPESGGEG
jgi:Mg/Co/Ni transporter MgtE